MITLAALALGVYGIDKHAGLQHDKMAVRAVSGLRDETNGRSFEAQPGGATPTCATAPVPTYGTSTQLLNGVESGGHCYYMMNPGETCDAACTRYGLGQCDEAALAAIVVPSQCGINGASSGECRVLPSGNACETVLSQFGLTQVGTIPWMSHGYFNGQDASQIGNAGYAGCAYGDWGASDHRIQMAIYDQNSGGTSCSGTSGDSSRRFVCSCASGSGSGPSMSNHLDITTETRDGCISGKVPGRTALTSGASCSNSTSVASAGSAAAAAAACATKYEQKSRGGHRLGQDGSTDYASSYDLVGELHLCEWRLELHRCEAGRVLTVCPEPDVVEVVASAATAPGGTCSDSGLIAGQASDFEGGETYDCGGWSSYTRPATGSNRGCKVQTDYSEHSSTGHLSRTCQSNQGGIRKTFTTPAGSYKLKFQCFAGTWDGEGDDHFEVSTDGGGSWQQHTCQGGAWRDIEHSFTVSGTSDIIIWANVGECIDVDDIKLEACSEGR